MREWKLFHPERFQGTKKKYHYFEGWYFKIAVQQPTKQVLSLIHIGENTFRWEKVHIRLTDEGLDLQADFSSWAGMPLCRGWSGFVSQSPPADAGKPLFNARSVRHDQHRTRSRFSILHVSDSRVEVVATKEHRIILIGTLGGASGPSMIVSMGCSISGWRRYKGTWSSKATAVMPDWVQRGIQADGWRTKSIV